MKIILPEKKLLNRTNDVDYYYLNYKFPIKYIQLYRFKAIVRLLGKKKYPRLLETGTGSGIFLPELSVHCEKLYASDIHPHFDNIDHQIINDIDYRNYLENSTKEGFERWDNVIELERLAAEHHSVGLHEFLENVALVSDQDTIDQNQETTTLLTLHAAKGLEFKQVMIIGVSEKILPHQRSFEDSEDMEEERRLFYVGITRAKDRLMLFHSLGRLTYEGFESLDASRYYEDIPSDLREEYYQSFSTRTNQKPVTTFSSWKEMNNENKRPVALERQYNPGDKVLHPKFGDGLVINSELREDDEIVSVIFEGLEKGDQKRMVIASLADMKKIS